MKQFIALLSLFLVTSCTPAPVPPPPEQRPAEPADLIEGISAGKTKLLDLGHTLDAQNPYWPGPGYGPLKYETFATLEKDGVLSGRFSMAEHTGTHLDAPNHFAAGQIPVDQIPLEQLFAPGVVVDVRAKTEASADYLLTPDDITAWEKTNGRIPNNAVVMMYTGWDSRWSDFDKYKNADAKGVLHFPGFSLEAAKLLVEERNIAGLGIDTLSVDYGMSKDFGVHRLSHSKGKYHLENVANLGSLPPVGAWIIVAPIKIGKGTGGPARIFALQRASS